MTIHTPGSSRPQRPDHKKHSPEWWQALDGNDARGKECEKIVKELFEKWNLRKDFAFHRLPDARSARGALAAQPSDFLYRCGDFAGFVEVKAVEHPTKITKTALRQLAQLQKWGGAGSADVILILHYMTGVWRVLDPRDLDISLSSWDVSKFTSARSAEAALMSTGFFS